MVDGNLSFRKRLFRESMELEVPFSSKVRLTRNTFKGKKAFIFAAGPSLNNVALDLMEEELKDSLVISIKQSLNVTKELCDVLLMNFCNFSDYDWESINTPVVWSSFDDKHSEIISSRGIKCDALLPVIENSTNDFAGLSQSTAGKGEWDNMLRLEEEKAIWGPGLMYELAIPIAINTGVNEIVLVGWDIGTLREKGADAFLNEHFYCNSNVEMKTKITNLEVEIVSRSTQGLMNWLDRRGVKLSIVSDRSLVHSDVRRIDKWIR